MTPETVHLLAQFVRFQRGFLTSVEKWANTQPPSQTIGEIVGVTSLMRDVLRGYEEQLEQVEPIDLRVEATTCRSCSGHSVRE